jgi:hypothetical protein
MLEEEPDDATTMQAVTGQPDQDNQVAETPEWTAEG